MGAAMEALNPPITVIVKEVAANDFLAKQEGMWWPDWFMAYDWKGTPIQEAYDEAVTLINNAISSYIAGTSSDDDRRKVVAEYRQI